MENTSQAEMRPDHRCTKPSVVAASYCVAVRPTCWSNAQTSSLTAKAKCCAISDDGEDYNEGGGEKTNASFEGGIVACELEEDRDYIDGEEDYSAARRGHGEEDEDCTRFEEFDREDTTSCGSEHSVYLLDSEYNKENARADEEAPKQTCQMAVPCLTPFLAIPQPSVQASLGFSYLVWLRVFQGYTGFISRSFDSIHRFYSCRTDEKQVL